MLQNVVLNRAKTRDFGVRMALGNSLNQSRLQFLVKLKNGHSDSKCILLYLFKCRERPYRT